MMSKRVLLSTPMTANKFLAIKNCFMIVLFTFWDLNYKQMNMCGMVNGYGKWSKQNTVMTSGIRVLMHTNLYHHYKPIKQLLPIVRLMSSSMKNFLTRMKIMTTCSYLLMGCHAYSRSVLLLTRVSSLPSHVRLRNCLTKTTASFRHRTSPRTSLLTA